MEGIVLIITLAIIVEAMVEYAKSIVKACLGNGWKTAITQIIAVIGAIVLCFASGADLFLAIGLIFKWTWLGVVLTGIIISRGANYVSDFVKRLQGVKMGDK
jgi:hypothetical protein